MVVFYRPAAVVEAHLGATGGRRQLEADACSRPVGVGPRQSEFKERTWGTFRDRRAPLITGPEAEVVGGTDFRVARAGLRPPAIKPGGCAYGVEDQASVRLDREVLKNVGHVGMGLRSTE